jgi:hypothetical protein
MERSGLFDAASSSRVALRFHPLLNRERLPHRLPSTCKVSIRTTSLMIFFGCFSPSQTCVGCLCLVRVVSPQINYLRWWFQSLTHYRYCQFLRVTLSPMTILYSSTRPPSFNLWGIMLHMDRNFRNVGYITGATPGANLPHSLGPRDP